MYDAGQVLDRISDHTVLVLALGAVALVFNYIFFGEAVRHARKDRCVPFGLVAVALWFPHDANYLLNFNHWFGTYDHWFPKLFWVGLIFTNVFEIVFITQVVRYGREEIAPRWSEAEYRVGVAAGLVLGAVFWAIAKSTLDDPLYLMTFLFTAVWALCSGGAQLLRRGSRRGQSPLEWLAFSGMCATYGACGILVFGGEFRDLPWLALTAAGVLGGLVLAAALARAEPWPGHADPIPVDERAPEAEVSVA